jgi:predicted membrane protein (TIGR00267 family)
MTVPPSQARHHDNVDPHVRSRWLADVILGAQDGVVNTLGVVLGVAAATSDKRVVFASGLAAGVAEAISMAAVAYTSSVARGDLYRSEQAREYRHVEHVPEVERDEIRAIYAAKGFTGQLLDRVVDTICSNKDVWVRVMMAEEHALGDVDRRESLRSAAIVGIAALVGAALPVLPFGALDPRPAIACALGVGTLLLFLLGAYKARLTIGRPSRSGAALALIGFTSAVAGYVVGRWLGVAP